MAECVSSSQQFFAAIHPGFSLIHTSFISVNPEQKWWQNSIKFFDWGAAPIQIFNSKYIKVLKFEIDSMRDGRGIDLLKCPNIGFMSVSKYILVNSTAIYHHCAANAKAEDQEGIAFICCSLCKQCNLKGRYIYNAGNDDSTC